MTDYENDEVTLAEMSADEEAVGLPENNDTDGICDGREEYERLIRDKYKEHFAADTQRLINRRFKKYKALEEKVKQLEEAAEKYADIEGLISSERERAVRETEERMRREFRANRTRAQENGLMCASQRPRMDVARLTRGERALLATRAQKGEKIHL